MSSKGRQFIGYECLCSLVFAVFWWEMAFPGFLFLSGSAFGSAFVMVAFEFNGPKD